MYKLLNNLIITLNSIHVCIKSQELLSEIPSAIQTWNTLPVIYFNVFCGKSQTVTFLYITKTVSIVSIIFSIYTATLTISIVVATGSSLGFSSTSLELLVVLDQTNRDPSFFLGGTHETSSEVLPHVFGNMKLLEEIHRSGRVRRFNCFNEGVLGARDESCILARKF